MELDVFIHGKWIPFSIFKQGKHREQIAQWLELTPHNYGMDNTLDHLLILAESLGTDIRHVDRMAGVSYQVHFKCGQQTVLASHVWEKGQRIKVIQKGACIPEDFVSELSHIIEV